MTYSNAVFHWVQMYQVISKISYKASIEAEFLSKKGKNYSFGFFPSLRIVICALSSGVRELKNSTALFIDAMSF